MCTSECCTFSSEIPLIYSYWYWSSTSDNYVSSYVFVYHSARHYSFKVAISLEVFSMGSMIWKWDQGVIDDLSCLFYWRPGVFLLELIGCCCPNLYLPFIHFLQPLQLDKRGNWLFFLAEKKSRRHIREQSPHFYWLSIIQTKNPIFPSIFARRRFSSELPDFIREFYWGVYGQTRLWERVIHDI